MHTYDEIHPDVAAVLSSEEVPETDVNRRYSDAQINCRDWAQADRIKRAGIWDASSEVFTDQTNKRPSVEIAFAYLSTMMRKKS